ncbi:N-acetyltransferase domain-containing protein [Madurella fahalii]|uniref:N-acetyltransferase domain-containing protein n=1 Tax=Madurella fahalii TaxID=1157608 RepID=A0ABQ0GN80_9PEZI
MSPRLGLPSDIEAVTNAVIRTMPLDPQWEYRFPYRHQYPEDHYKYTRMLFEYFLDPSYDDWLVMVAEDNLEPGSTASVVSFGVFNVSYLNKRRYGPGYKPQDPVTEVEKRGGKTRRDANHKHYNEFWHGQIRAYKKLFAPLGPEQVHLQILGTLPEFQRRGHASSLCRWAMELALRDSLKDISVMASPMGYNLYTWLGFKKVATFYIQVPGEEERVVLQAMMYTPEVVPDAEGGCMVI